MRELSRESQPSEGRKKETRCSLTQLSFSVETRDRDRKAAKRNSRSHLVANHLRAIEIGKSFSYRVAPRHSAFRVLFANLASIVALSLSDSPATSLQTDRCDTEGRDGACSDDSTHANRRFHENQKADGLPFLSLFLFFSPSSLACLPGVKTESPSSGT